MASILDIRSAVIIYNPLSGRGHSKQYAAEAKRRLMNHGCDVLDVLPTEYGGHARKVLVPAWCNKVEMLVVISGDGTLREIVSGLIDQKSMCCLGFIPLGNANVVARELNIPRVPEKAMEVLLNRHFRYVDVGLFTTAHGQVECFLAMLEVGRGARIVHIAQQLRFGAFRKIYKWWGDFVYFIASLLSLRDKNSQSFDIVVGSTPLEGAFYGGFVCSMATYSKGWSVSPEARCDDGVLNLVASKKNTPASFMQQMLAARQRTILHRPWLREATGKFIEFTSDRDLCIQADGDAIERCNTLSIEILPKAVRILTPAHPD